MVGKRWSVEYQFLILALLPAALTALIFTLYHAHHRVTAVESRATQQAQNAAEQLALTTTLAATAHDAEFLHQSLQTGMDQYPGIITVRLRDSRNAVLMEAHGHAHPSSATAPVTPSTRTITRGITSGRSDTQALGFTPTTLEVDVDLSSVRATRANALMEGAIISMLALAVTGLIAKRFTGRIIQPIRDMTTTIERIADRDPDPGLEPTMPGEMGRLQQGIATMIAELRSSQTEMETRVQSATHELQATMHELEARNAELNEARLAAEAASEFKSRFLANMSHEIRTPMNSILGFAELLREGDMDSAHADYVETIHESAIGLLSLLNSLLDLSKIESGRMELEFAEFNLNQVLTEVFRLLGQEAFHKGVELVVLPVDASRSHVIGDPVRLKQILLNLTANAIKFTDGGHVLVIPSTRLANDGFTDVLFRIEDSGCGIPQECRDHLFEAFAQGEGTSRNMARGGAGLGLHIASELVFLMDGDLEFDSEPGHGSVFQAAVRLRAAGQQTNRNPKGLLRPGRILLVEHDSTLRARMAQLFRAAGADCKPLPSPYAASRMAGRNDVVMIHMPASAVRADNIPVRHSSLWRSGLIVIAYSHVQDSSTRGAIVDAGYDGMVAKTADPEELRRDLMRVIAQHSSSDPDIDGDRPATCNRTAPQLHSALIVDDHPVNRKLLQHYMRNHCTILELAESGTEAIFVASREAFDVILLDLHMPDIHGLEIARRIHQDSPLNCTTPIMLITADAFAMEQQDVANDIIDVLVKPVRQRDLLDRIAHHCSPTDCVPVQAQAPRSLSGSADACASDQVSLVNELRTLLLESLPASRDAVADAIGAQDREALRSATHRLHGAVAYCDEPELRSLAETIERAILRGENWTDVKCLGNQLLTAIDDRQRRGHQGRQHDST